MRMGLDIAQQRMSFAEVVARAQFAEGLGFDGVWGFDHFRPMYGEGVGECFEGMSTLAALSGVTERVRLGLLVAGYTYRPIGLFAAQALTIDHASNGRLELTLGAAWFEQEHRALGLPFPPTGERVGMFDEALTVLRGLLTQENFSFEGRFYTITDATLYPHGVQQPHPPIWVGATQPRMIDIAARHADVWHSFGPAEWLADKAALLDERAEAAGRDPSSIMRAGSLSIEGDWNDVRKAADAFRHGGFGYLVVGWPGDGHARVEEFVRDVMPEFTH
jgi:alkanesulfonate monooxygenase SsuD/methylene tetrahydromethanopterin reductase-like flavin-dependent oxidoreductase (luciferase family)